MDIVVSLLLVLAVARVLRLVLVRLRQPPVMAEVLAGIVLGASMLDVSTFTESARTILIVPAEVAAGLYLLGVGARLDLRAARQAKGVALTSFLVPFAAGAALAVPLHAQVDTDAPLVAFALFLATALSVTALPVLARILDAQGLADAPAGRLALAAAGGQELLVWPALAVAVLAAGAGALPWTVAVVGGSFLLGVALPSPQVRRVTTSAPARAVMAAGLPLFFALPALAVDLGALGGAGIGLLALVLVVAVSSKLLSATFAARRAGLGRSDARRVGVLMNARGLVELVVLSVGLDAGLIDTRLYGVLVLMALVTTFATGPLLALGDRRRVNSGRESFLRKHLGQPQKTQLPGGSPMTRLAVIYYSSTGHVHKLAEAIAAGAEETGAEVRLRRVPELAPEDVVRAQDAWHEHAMATRDTVAEATLDDLEWADGYAFGTPTRYGTPAAQLKQFIDTTGPLWAKGILADKAVTSFTSAMNAHGGAESTILALNNVFYHWGSLIVAPGYTDPLLYASGGNPYGTSYASGQDIADELPEEIQEAARYQGRRWAQIAAQLAAGRDSEGRFAPALAADRV